jgi:hypothetical protein
MEKIETDLINIVNMSQSRLPGGLPSLAAVTMRELQCSFYEQHFLTSVDVINFVLCLRPTEIDLTTCEEEFFRAIYDDFDSVREWAESYIVIQGDSSWDALCKNSEFADRVRLMHRAFLCAVELYIEHMRS